MYREEIGAGRERWLRRQADRLRNEFWSRTELELGRPLANSEKLPVRPEAIATSILRLRYEEPEEIGVLDKGSHLRIELAGLLSRSERKISVAQKFSSEIRRFTGAHEIAHYLIHPDVLNMRESPMTDGMIRYQQKSRREKEADLFAAELLVPSEIVFELFGRLFGDGVDGSQISDDLAYCLSNGKLPASTISRLQPLESAKLIAAQPSLVTTQSRSLTEIFGVSATVVGIQLLDLRLVN